MEISINKDTWVEQVWGGRGEEISSVGQVEFELSIIYLNGGVKNSGG